jgi:penicillin-binding protein 1B
MKKTSAKKTSLKPRTSVFTQANHHPSRLWGAFWSLFLLFSLSAGFWLFLHLQYLDNEIKKQFEQSRLWAIPARVYARPLELYPDQALDQESLLRELRAGRYREERTLASEGSFFVEKNTVRLKTRAFAFSDGLSPSQEVTLQFSAGKLKQIQASNGENLALLRLDPLLLGSFFPLDQQDRELVRLEEVPAALITLLLATEDKRFYQHIGIDLQGIFRALSNNFSAGRTVQGGSTLTQQLVKNYFLSSERTLKRKVNEALMALLLERRYSKEAILEAYLNEIYLGQEGGRAIHGFGLASQFYFDKNIKDLNLQEMALLVGLAKGASYYDPRKHPQRALARRNLVLNNAAATLAAADLAAALAAPLGVVAKPSRGQSDFPAYLDLVQRQLKQDYPEEVLRSEGLKIFTAFDPHWQYLAEQAVANQLPKLEKSRALPENSLQAAVVMVDVNTGEIRALVGDRQAGFAGFNRALDAKRQVGSTIKPFVYLAALLQSEVHAVSQLRDTELALDVGSRQLWRPQNYDQKFRGTVSLVEALANSYNLPAVRLGLAAGLDNVLLTLKKAGIEAALPRYPSLFLGAADLSPLELTQGYQTLAAEGFYVPLRSIREVLDAQGQVQQRYPLRTEQRFDSNQVAVLLDLLKRVFREGTAQGGRVAKVELAGKTGTTDELRDSWFVGFSAETLTTVWVGRDDNQISKLTGASGALPIFQSIMQALPLTSVTPTVNAQVNYFWADRRNGKLATPGCAGAELFLFYIEKMPSELSENCR